MRRILSYDFIRFCFVGVVSSVIDIAILYSLVEFVHTPVLFAAACGLLLASLNGYTLNKLFTFKDQSEKIKRQYAAYLSVSLCGMFFSLVLLSIFIEFLSMYYLFAKAITIVIVVAWNYSANRLFVFRKTVL